MIDLPQANDNTSCDDSYEIEAVISFDERGQLVFPKDVRKKFNLKAGEKFLMISCTSNDELCCFSIIKTKALNKMVGGALGPMLSGFKK